MATLHRIAPLSAALSLSLALLTGCGDDDNSDDTNKGDTSVPLNPLDSSVPLDATMQQQPDTGLPVDNDPNKPALYYFTMGLISQDGTATQYVLLRDKLDFNITLDDLKAARPFAGYSGVTAINGNMIVGRSDEPFALKYKIEADNKTWTELEKPLNFSDYVSDDGDGLNYYWQAIRGSDMFLHHGTERTSRVHWNVDQWKIIGNQTETKLPLATTGLTFGSTGNRTWARDWKADVFQTFIFRNAQNYLSGNSYIAIYDGVTGVEKSVLEVPCGGLQQQTIDEEGNAYFSTTDAGSILLAWFKLLPETCLVKLKPDGTRDETFPKNVEAFTNGNPGVNFRYLAKGKAFANVLRKNEELAGVSFDGPPDLALAKRIAGAGEVNGFAEQKFWERRLLNLTNGTSQVITGWERVDFNPNYMLTFSVDGRHFLVAQYDPYGNPQNYFYELNLDTAVVTLVGKITIGELGNVGRVR